MLAFWVRRFAACGVGPSITGIGNVVFVIIVSACRHFWHSHLRRVSKESRVDTHMGLGVGVGVMILADVMVYIIGSPES